MRIINSKFLPPNYMELGLETTLVHASGKSWGPQSATLVRKLTPEGKRHYDALEACRDYYNFAENLGLEYDDAREFVDEIMTDEEAESLSWQELEQTWRELYDALQYLAEWKASIESECTCANGVAEGVIDGQLCEHCRAKLEDKEIPY